MTTLTKLGETFFSLGGTMLVLGLVFVKFQPWLLSWFGKLPGDSLTPGFILPVVSIIVSALSFTAITVLFGLILKLIR